MDFHTVEIEDELNDLDTDDLRSIVREYQEAQQANLEAVEDVADDIDEFQDHKEEITEQVIEMAEIPEDDVRAMSFSGRKSLLARLEDDEADDGDFEEDGDGGAEFDDMGNRGETHNEDGTPEAIERAFSNISGVVLE